LSIYKKIQLALEKMIIVRVRKSWLSTCMPEIKNMVERRFGDVVLLFRQKAKVRRLLASHVTVFHSISANWRHFYCGIPNSFRRRVALFL